MCARRELLQVPRVDHGNASMRTGALCKLLAQRQIPLTSAPVQTSSKSCVHRGRTH